MNLDNNAFILDSGATDHVIKNRQLFTSYSKLTNPQFISVGNGAKLQIHGKGTVTIPGTSIELINALHLPNIINNLIPVPQLAKIGYQISFQTEDSTITTPENKTYNTILKNNLYQIHTCVRTQDLHKTLGQASDKQLKQLISSTKCEICPESNMKTKKFGKRDYYRAKEAIQIIHSDIFGPVNVTSNNDARFFISFIDDWSRFTTIYFIRYKSEAFEKFQEYRKMVENQHKSKIQILYTDCGGEYSSTLFTKFCKIKGIKIFWAEALNTACLIKNILPNAKGIIPFQRWHNKIPNLKFFKTFGCLVYVKKEKPESKFHPQSKK